MLHENRENTIGNYEEITPAIDIFLFLFDSTDVNQIYQIDYSFIQFD
jgi:hypothetical protein